MIQKRTPAFLLALAAIGSYTPEATAYEVNCNGQSFMAQKISTVLGELRPSVAGGITAQGNSSARFHTGTDIADCSDNQTVGAIEDGTVKTITCGSDGLAAGDCEVLVVNTAGTHRFDYVHLAQNSIDVSTGDPVAAMTRSPHRRAGGSAPGTAGLATETAAKIESSPCGETRGLLLWRGRGVKLCGSEGAQPNAG